MTFVNEDWTGLTHRQIKSMILSELEEQQCKEEGHHWIPAYYCGACGLRSEDALEEMTKKIKNNKKRKVRNWSGSRAEMNAK